MEAREAEPSVVSQPRKQAQDLLCGRSMFLLWCLPGIALVAGLSWTEARPWLWTPAFLVMGIACVVNATQCGRLHCFVTGPLYLLAAVYVPLAAFGLLPMRPDIFLGAVLGITVLAFLAELPLGKYRKRC
jgi:hypothetical protein